MIVFAKNYRGFRNLEIDTRKLIFLTGDNSSGKSSILYLVDAVCNNDLNAPPKLDDDFGVDQYDYFSPYFKNSDVTFGFRNNVGAKNEIAKIITVRRTDDYPDVLKCSYWVPGLFVTIRKRRGAIEVRVIDDVDVKNTRSLIRIHESSGLYGKLETFKPETVCDISALLAAVDIKDERFKTLISAVLALEIKPCRLISPIRALPERFYTFRRKVQAQGSHFAAMWIDLRQAAVEVFDQIDQFGRESKLFDKMYVEKISQDIEKPPLLVTVDKNGNKFSMQQVGIGVSQVVPILIDSIFSSRLDKSPVLIMQPELHLHPVAQAALGTFFYKLSKLGMKGILETHSSFMMDRFRSDLKSDHLHKIDGVDAEIIFCENRSNGNFVYHIPISEDGEIKNEPAVYHKFFVDELIRTLS